MKRVLFIVAIVALALAGFWAARAWNTQQQSNLAQAAAAKATPTQEANAIWASGKLVPASWAGLSPAAGGTVHSVRVTEGEQVTAGMVLIELDNAVLQRQVEVAAAALGEAQATRDKLLAGATQQQLAQAQAEVAAAEANVAVAQAGIKQAREAAAAAQAQVSIAQAQYDELASRPNEGDKVVAQREVDVTLAEVRQAQAAYDQVKGSADIAARPEAVALEQATARFQAARAGYDAATRGATPQQLAVANAQIKAAVSQAQVTASQVPSAEAGVQAASAQLARAKAALEAWQAGATTEDRGVAESRVQSARAQLGAVQAQLAQTQVTAPFAGQVGSILIRPGEQAVPGQAVLMLGDTARLRVETTDLRETDVTRLNMAAPAEVTFDALPGRTFQGRVTRIAPMSTIEKGSTNYTVMIDVQDIDARLRWGMTAFVNIPAR